MMILFLMMKVLQCLQVMEDAKIVLLVPSTIPIEIAKFIILVTMVEVDLGLKILATLFLTIV